MRTGLLLATILVIVSAARAEDPFVRGSLQDRYREVDEAASSGKFPWEPVAPKQFRMVDLSKKVSSYDVLLTDWRTLTSVRRTTRVESADVLQDVAKAAIRVQQSETRKENGRLIHYQREYTALDKWIRAGEGWRLVETRLTRLLVRREGKVITREEEKVLTDFDRQYRRSGSSSPSARRGRKGA